MKTMKTVFETEWYVEADGVTVRPALALALSEGEGEVAVTLRVTSYTPASGGDYEVPPEPSDIEYDAAVGAVVLSAEEQFLLLGDERKVRARLLAELEDTFASARDFDPCDLLY